MADRVTETLKLISKKRLATSDLLTIFVSKDLGYQPAIAYCRNQEGESRFLVGYSNKVKFMKKMFQAGEVGVNYTTRRSDNFSTVRFFKHLNGAKQYLAKSLREELTFT